MIQLYAIYQKYNLDSKTLIGRMEKDTSCKQKHQRSGIVILLSDKINSKTKNITRDKVEYFIMAKGSIHQEDIITDTYTSKNTVPKYMQQKQQN